MRKSKYIKPGIIFVLVLLLLITGCDNNDSLVNQDVEEINESTMNQIVAQDQVIAQAEIFPEGHSMGILSLNAYLQDDLYSGQFDVIVFDTERNILNSISLNDVFSQDVITLPHGTLSVSDYNDDGNSDVVIGIGDDSGNDEYRYAVFSVNEEGSISVLPTSGYKEDGFIYSISSGNYARFVFLHPNSNNGRPGIAIGVKDDSVFVPAKYQWDGHEFVFVKDSEYIISQSTIPSDRPYSVSIVQTRFSQPHLVNDASFSMYESFILGEFDVVTSFEDKEISRISLNGAFGGREIGWIDHFPLELNDYNNDGEYEFTICQPNNNDIDIQEFQHVMIGIKSDGTLSKIDATGYKEDGFIYSMDSQPSFNKLIEPEMGLEVSLSDSGGVFHGQYTWDENEDVYKFRKSSN